MGFLQEIKVFLSTVTADELDDGFSGAKWNLASRLSAINPLYKMKMKLLNVSIPNTFERFSTELGNSSLTLVFSADGNTEVNVPLDISQNRFIKINVIDGISNEINLVEKINRELHNAYLDHLVLKDMDWLPVFMINDTYTQVAMSMQRFFSGLPINPDSTLGIEPVQTIMNIPDRTVDGTDYTAKVIVREHPYNNPIRPKKDLLNPNVYQYDADGEPILEYVDTPIANIGDRVGPNEYNIAKLNFKILTEADLRGTTLKVQDVGLSRVIGFDRTVSYPSIQMKEIVPNKNYGTLYSKTHIDMTGTRFIAVTMPDLNIANIDPFTKGTGRVVACLPVTTGNQGFQNMTIGGIQESPYVTISQDTLHSFKILLRNDRDRPLRVSHDWFAEFAIRIEEPERTDAYRGNGDIPRFPKSGDPDPGEYGQLTVEMMRSINDIDRQEARERENYTKRVRMR